MVARGPLVYPSNLLDNWYQSQVTHMSIQVPQVARMTSGTACLAGGAGEAGWKDYEIMMMCGYVIVWNDN